MAVTAKILLLFWSQMVICTAAGAVAPAVVAERANSTRALAAMERVVEVVVVVYVSVPLPSWANVVAASLLS